MNKEKIHAAIAAIAYNINDIRELVESWNIRDPYSREYLAILELLDKMEGIDHILHDEIF